VVYSTPERDRREQYSHIPELRHGIARNFGVFDGDGSTHNLTGPPGSAAIEKLFVEHFKKNGVNVTAARFTGGSDYQSFMNIGKPVGGLHTGTGVEQDPCYHQACDTIDNPNPTTLTINAKVSTGRKPLKQCYPY
jgi:Zn-dependent M28 family amino/carboxypeptidase